MTELLSVTLLVCDIAAVVLCPWLAVLVMRDLALHNPDAENRGRARAIELETYAAELGDDA